MPARLGFDMTTAPESRRDLAAAAGLAVVLPLACFGLLLPFHEYEGVGSGTDLAALVDSESLTFATAVTVLTVLIAVLPVAVWPRFPLRVAALGVLLLALWNLVNSLSYYWWRSDLVFCHGGC